MVRTRVGRRLAAAALFATAFAGCKNGFEIPVWNPFAKPDHGSITRDSDGGHWQDESIQPRESALSRSFKKFGETVSKPFKKDPVATIAPEDEAISVMSKAEPPGPELFVSLARMEAKAGNVKTAIEQYRKALDVDPDHVGALVGLARLYDREGDSAKAVEYYRRAAKANPDDGTALNDLGLCYARNGRLDESIATLKRAVELAPDEKLYRNNLATVLVEAGRAQEAFRTLMPVHGEAVAHYNVGFLLDHCGRKSEALGHFQAAVDLDPNFAQAKKWVALLSNHGSSGSAPAGRTASSTREPKSIARATEAADAVPLDGGSHGAGPLGAGSIGAGSLSAGSDTAGGSRMEEADAVPLDTPIATPYVPQSDLAPTGRPVSRPISRSTVVEDSPRAEPKPVGRMPPMDPHRPPQVELPRSSNNGAGDQPGSDELIGPKLMQKRSASGDRYEVAGPARVPAAPSSNVVSRTSPRATHRDADRSAAVPPVPEQVSTLPAETLVPDSIAPESTTPAPKTRTAASPRYPASRY